MKKLMLGFAVLTCSFVANATNNIDYQKQIDQLRSDLNTTYSYVNTKYTESWGLEDRANIADLKKNKVDVGTFNEDQKRQDNALAKETSERTAADNKIVSDQKVVDAKQDAAINSKVDKSTYAADQQAQSKRDSYQDHKISTAQSTANAALGLGVANSIGLAAESYDRQTADRNLQNQINSGVAKDKDQDKLIASKANQSDLNKEITSRTNADAALQNQISTNKSEQASIDNSQNVRMDGIESQAAFNDGRIGKTEVRLDTAEQGIRDNQKQIAVTDARSINNAVRIDGVESKNAEQDVAISNKVDNSTFLTDQARQDKALASESDARKSGDKMLQKSINTEASTRATADTKLQNNINAEAKSRASADKVLSNRIDSNTETLVQHDQRITSNTQRVGNVENRMANYENQTNQRFSNMDKRIGDNRKLASAGIAGAGAMANIPQVSQDSTFSVGAGVGGYDDQNAVAVGFSARINNNIVTKVSASTNSASEVLWGAGASVEW